MSRIFFSRSLMAFSIFPDFSRRVSSFSVAASISRSKAEIRAISPASGLLCDLIVVGVSDQRPLAKRMPKDDLLQVTNTFLRLGYPFHPVLNIEVKLVQVHICLRPGSCMCLQCRLYLPDVLESSFQTLGCIRALFLVPPQNVRTHGVCGQLRAHATLCHLRSATRH